MLATRSFWFRPPVRYDPSWSHTLATYRQHTEPWPTIPEPSTEDYIEHLLLTKDSAPGPDGLPYALWRMIPHHTAAILKDDFERMLTCTLPAPTQVGVWIPKAKQGPTADFFRPLGMPDTLDRLQDGTAAAILFRATRHCFHTAQTMLNVFREPQRAVLEVQQALEGTTPASALFADLSKAFERVNAYWILHILHIRQCVPWVLQLAKYLLFGRRVRHKVQGRLLPPRAVHSGVDLGRSTSVYFFCLAMDPIFVALHQVPRVLLVAGYVDDTTIVGHQSDPQWIKEVFSLIDSWSTAGVVMDAHTCWQVGFSTEPLTEQQLLRYEDVAKVFRPWHEQGEATVSRAIQHIPSYAQYFVLRHGEHCALFRACQIHDWLEHGHPLLLQLAASPCTCRSKTQLLISDALTAAQLYQVDRAGLGNQCIVPTTVNLGLTLHTGWACSIQTEEMEYSPLRRDAPSLLSKQLLKFRTRIAAGIKGNLSINAKIIYFNAFSLSLFYYVQTHRYFSPRLLAPLYKTLADFLLKRHWFPQHKLVGICRWLRLGPLLDPTIMHAVSLFGCYLRQGHDTLPAFVRDTDESYRRQVFSCWKFWQQQLSSEEIRRLLDIFDQPQSSPRNIKRFLDLFKQLAIGHLIDSSVVHLSSRISQNGWTYGPSIEFLEWLAQTLVSYVGAVPRFAVLRWALGEDADLWLPLRGRVSRTSPCIWRGRNARNYPAGPARGSLCHTCTGLCPSLPSPMPGDLVNVLNVNGVGCGEGTSRLHHLFRSIADKLHSSSGPLTHAAPIPCVLCQGGANAIDHWLSYCPVVHAAWILLWKGTPPPLNWQQTPVRSTGVAMCYLLFHTRRLVTEHGGLRPTIECLKLRSLQSHARDLWQRVYQSLPATLLQCFRAPPIQQDLPCTDTTHIKVQRFPRTQIDSALLPEKGLSTTRAFSKQDTIATFSSSDVRLRMLSMQYRKLPFPAATAALLPYTCHCGHTHIKLQATDDIPDNAILLIGEAAGWQGCLVQFDGSAHKRTHTGGAGVSLLQVTQETTTLVRWKSVPLAPCADNVIAEAKACLAAIHLAIEYQRQCLAQGIAQEGIIIQGDILPLLNYLQGKGRVKRREVVDILEDCQNLLACAPFIFRLVYLPRECNKLADYFAGQASAQAKLSADQPLNFATYRAAPPYHLAQKLGFVIESGPLQPAPAFVLTECPATSPDGLPQLLSRLPSHIHIAQDYLAAANNRNGVLTIGYKPSSLDGFGRFYAVGLSAQQLPRQVRLLLFGDSHCEIDISGAHYELTRRCCAHSNVHLSLPPIQRTREWLRRVLQPPDPQVLPEDYEDLIKKWPLVVINSAEPQEALGYLVRQLSYLPCQLPPDITRFAYELHAASRFVINNPPSWCPVRERDRSRAAPFRFFEVLEQHLSWAAYNFLQSLVGFHSAIWLHDGFWVAPGPTVEHLSALHDFLVNRYHLSPDDPPLFRCEHLGHKHELLKKELIALPLSSPKRRRLLRRLPAEHPLPLQATLHRKRRFQADGAHAQEQLEERLAKRARFFNHKRQRLR